jgi:hypothetical protein
LASGIERMFLMSFRVGIYSSIILEFFEEDWSPLPTLIGHTLVYTALQGKFDATLTGMEKGNASSFTKRCPFQL